MVESARYRKRILYVVPHPREAKRNQRKYDAHVSNDDERSYSTVNMQRAVNKSTFRYNSTLIVRLVILPVFDCNGCCNDEYAVVGAVASAF